MIFQNPFDAQTVDPSSFAPPPPMGDYHVRIIESEAKPTNDGQGGYVEVTLEIGDPGPYQGRKVPYRLNLFNAKQQTVEIAYRQLSALCYVTGVMRIEDTRQLHGIPFIATIGPQKDDPRFSNVFQVKDNNGNPPQRAGGQPAAPAPTAPAPPTWGAPAPQPSAAPTPGWGSPTAAQPAPTAPPWATPAAAPAPPAAAPAPAWGAPPAAPAAPAWGAQPQPAAAPAQPAAPPWAPAQAAPAAPPWANR